MAIKALGNYLWLQKRAPTRIPVDFLRDGTCVSVAVSDVCMVHHWPVGVQLCVSMCCLAWWPPCAGGVSPSSVTTAGEREDNEW